MFSFSGTRAIVLAGLIGAVAAPMLPAQAQTQRHAAALIDHAQPRFAAATQVLGAADPAAIVHLQIALRLRDAADLTVRSQAGAHLGFAELESRYLPTRADYAAVIAWLRSQGLAIERVHDSRLTIGVSGRADAVGRALGVKFRHIQSEGRTFTATDDTPSVPASLSRVILSVNGLQPQLHAEPLLMQSAAATFSGYTPTEFLTAYNAKSFLLKGAGTTTAVVIDTFPQTSDLTTFWRNTHTPQTLSNIDFIQVNKGTLPYQSGEETLDTEITSSIGPSSKVRVYAAGSLDFAAIDNDFQAIISDLKKGVGITQVSISLGACESGVGFSQVVTDDQFFAVIQSMGVSVFVATGDSGSYECGDSAAATPSFYSTSPNVTAVGGTTLNLASTGARKSEIAWDGSGGGKSTIFDQPLYQAGLRHYIVRTVPDVAADANPVTGTYFVFYGQAQSIGGTSLAAPLWAGLTGLINATRLADGKKPLGAMNHYLYSLPPKKYFYDVTIGSNGAYSAGPGYDLVTGLGTPDPTAALVSTLMAKP